MQRKSGKEKLACEEHVSDVSLYSHFSSANEEDVFVLRSGNEAHK
jgi:hypothetical protein